MNLIYCKQMDPLSDLRLICSDFGIQFLRDMVQRYAIVTLNHELLFKPELLLEVLYLSDEIDNLMRNRTKDFYL